MTAHGGIEGQTPKIYGWAGPHDGAKTVSMTLFDFSTRINELDHVVNPNDLSKERYKRKSAEEALEKSTPAKKKGKLVKSKEIVKDSDSDSDQTSGFHQHRPRAGHRRCHEEVRRQEPENYEVGAGYDFQR
ncbi:hypothetical protein IQ06DRAFT_300590 [Phaeosphaeriaceae sp. SRC1lsM3a]|nr:hypothetical protein IQ06DRAFT_300590 [Stagonospora sp. SRC1lsM3a]